MDEVTVTLSRRERQEISDLLYREYDEGVETALGNRGGPDLSGAALKSALAKAERYRQLSVVFDPRS